MTEPNSQLGIGEIIASKYRVDQVIGEGGMGTVYAATHQVTGKRVALKWMLPQLSRDAEAVGRFLREAQAAGRINHPNVVDVYDVGKHGDSMFLVMELLRGEPLASIVDRGRVPWPDALRLVMPALRGVGAAHDGGVIHRDLKPDNIFITCDHDGTRRDAKVLDFGISKLTTKAGENLRLTKTGSVMGTPYYMAPEQIQGIRDIDERTDIYALGVILYQTLAGDLPFKAQTYHALIVEIATGTPTPLRQHAPDVPPELDAIVVKAMAREPDRRFQSVKELMIALESLDSPTSYPGLSRPDSLVHREPSVRVQAVRPSTAVTLTPFTSDSPSVRTTVRSSPLVWVGAALLGLLVLGGGSFGVYSWLRAPSSSANTHPPIEIPTRAATGSPPSDSLTGSTPAVPVTPAPTTPSVAVVPPPPIVPAPPIAPAAQPPTGELPPLIDPTPVLATPTGSAGTTPSATSSPRRPTRDDRRTRPIGPVGHPPTIIRPPVVSTPPIVPPPTRRAGGRTGQLRPDEF